MITVTHRVPYWFAPVDLNDLTDFLRKDVSDPDKQQLLEDIRNEIGVAKLRAETTRIDTNSLIVVLGLTEGSLPIHLSDTETNFLLSLEDLPQSVRNRLL